MIEYTIPLASRSAKSVAVDNLLRRALRVSDPADPQQVAKGLLVRYPQVADQIERERQGLNVRSIAEPLPAPAFLNGASGAEIVQAHDDLERDLATLTTASELKDISVELLGWGRAVRRAASEGLASARVALDSVQHDRAMAARRTLGDYARLARYVGTLTADSTPRFRRLAQSLDVLAALILVSIGEGLAAKGVTRGTAIIRVAASELRSRRDAVISTLRALTGSGMVVLGQEDYPRGPEAHRILVDQLQKDGQSDLRVLLDEGTMGYALDHLVDLSVGANPATLRELTTASGIFVERLQRLRGYCNSIEVPADGQFKSPDSPPLAFFASALQMFIDAFNATELNRLIFIARPHIVTQGLYGSAGTEKGTSRLIELTLKRGIIAGRADCHAGCGCDDLALNRQIMLDHLLNRLDRAIDLYALGSSEKGKETPEIMAAAWSLTYEAARAHAGVNLDGIGDSDLKDALDDTSKLLKKAHGPSPKPDETKKMHSELKQTYLAEERLFAVVQSLSPGCLQNAPIVQEVIKKVLGPPVPSAQTAVLMPQPIQALNDMFGNRGSRANRLVEE